MLIQLQLKFSSGFVVLSPGAKERIRNLGFKNKPIILIPNGCDTDYLKPLSFKNTNSINAVYFGAHGYANGLDYLVDFSKWLNFNHFEQQCYRLTT